MMASSLAAATATDDTATAVQKYGAFVEDVLKPQLQASLAQRDALSAEIREYEELLAFLRDEQQRQQHEQAASAADSKPSPLHMLMDLGQRFQVRAKVADPSRIIVDIGLNFHVEMTLPEAERFVTGHLTHLEGKRRTWQEKAQEISRHVTLVLEAIQKLATLQQS
ncbi:hypothetical protein P43SY_008823 [Pythium insidiosum]|uniref:Prefoldin, alpha subunit n=1 Tax=Pythium insidiosum TaxID=114742 RepID=A0AAD5Q5S7_PYTIN|nr:hypothetical protein ATCC90586_011482 [Pythium insidiosum]KAJ0399626.1 hypothetical protein P43SY_008823 [Pythium insidiosum]